MVTVSVAALVSCPVMSTCLGPSREIGPIRGTDSRNLRTYMKFRGGYNTNPLILGDFMSFDCLDEKATQTGFAGLIGISQPAVAGRVRDGRLPEGGTYLEWLQVYCEDLREVAGGRNDEQDFKQSRAEDMAATAALKRLKYHEELGQLIRKEEALDFLGSWARTTNIQINAAFDQMIAAVENSHGIEIDPQLREKYAGTAIKRIRAAALQFGADADGSGGDI